MSTNGDLRLPLSLFAQHMEAKLKANDQKGGWEEMSLFELVGRSREEFFELEEAIHKFRHKESSVDALLRVRKEAVDVANFAMMIADNAERDHQEAVDAKKAGAR